MAVEQAHANGVLSREVTAESSLAFIDPSLPGQLSANSGKPNQDMPCKLSLPPPF